MLIIGEAYKILHNDIDITKHVISFSRTASICDGEETINLEVVEYSSFNIFDTIKIYEYGNLVKTFYIDSISRSVPNDTLNVTASDMKRIRDYFIADNYIVDYPSTPRYWIEKFITEAGGTVVFTTPDSGGYLSNNTSLGMTTLKEQLVSLLQLAGWYMRTDEVGNIVIGSLEASRTNYKHINRALSFTRNKDDSILRNRVVVWGSTIPERQLWVYADVSKPTNWDIDGRDKRTVVIANSNIPTVGTAYSIATKALDEFSHILDTKTLTYDGVSGMKLGDTAFIDLPFYKGFAMLTSYTKEVSQKGAIETLIFDEFCPRLFAYWGWGTDYVYVATNNGIYRKLMITNSGDPYQWYDYNAGLPEDDRDTLQVKVSNGILTTVTSGGNAYHTQVIYNYWTPITYSGKAISTGISNGNIYVAYNFEDEEEYQIVEYDVWGNLNTVITASGGEVFDLDALDYVAYVARDDSESVYSPIFGWLFGELPQDGDYMLTGNRWSPRSNFISTYSRDVDYITISIPSMVVASYCGYHYYVLGNVLYRKGNDGTVESVTLTTDSGYTVVNVHLSKTGQYVYPIITNNDVAILYKVNTENLEIVDSIEIQSKVSYQIKSTMQGNEIGIISETSITDEIVYEYYLIDVDWMEIKYQNEIARADDDAYGTDGCGIGGKNGHFIAWVGYMDVGGDGDNHFIIDYFNRDGSYRLSYVNEYLMNYVDNAVFDRDNNKLHVINSLIITDDRGFTLDLNTGQLHEDNMVWLTNALESTCSSENISLFNVYTSDGKVYIEVICKDGFTKIYDKSGNVIFEHGGIDSEDYKDVKGFDTDKILYLDTDENGNYYLTAIGTGIQVPVIRGSFYKFIDGMIKYGYYYGNWRMQIIIPSKFQCLGDSGWKLYHVDSESKEVTKLLSLPGPYHVVAGKSAIYLYPEEPSPTYYGTNSVNNETVVNNNFNLVTFPRESEINSDEETFQRKTFAIASNNEILTVADTYDIINNEYYTIASGTVEIPISGLVLEVTNYTMKYNETYPKMFLSNGKDVVYENYLGLTSFDDVTENLLDFEFDTIYYIAVDDDL